MRILGNNRRAFIKCGLVSASILLLPKALQASPADVNAAIINRFGEDPLQTGRVTVTLPPISENGYSVPLTVEVHSPMTPDDHVVRIGVFAEENPLPQIAEFHLDSRAGRAKIETRIRMGGSQRIRAVAEMNDGSLWTGHDFSVVTLAACVL